MICPGTILHCQNYQFDDGETRDKYLIVLNDGSCGYYLYVETTSKMHDKGIIFGCQPNDRQPNFFLLPHCGYFQLNTWIMFNHFKKRSLEYFHGCLVNKTMTRKRIFNKEMARQIIDCATDSDDIENADRNVLFEIIRSIDQYPFPV